GANLLVVPLAALLTTGGILTLAVAALSEPLAHALFQSLWLLLVLLRLVVRAFAALPGAVVFMPPPPALAMGAAGLVLLVLPGVHGRVATLGVAALAIGSGLATLAAGRSDGLAHLLVLDVGQGEAILIQAPEGPTLLVDTGGSGPGRGDRGERVVVPVLRRLGLRRLTALALTDGAPDHGGGLAGLREGMPVGEVWIPAGVEGAPWLDPVVARGIPQRVLVRGDHQRLGSLLVTTLHPPPAEQFEDSVGAARLRSEPLLLRIEWDRFAAVLAAGTGPAAEAS